jgi:hypothetical protein
MTFNSYFLFLIYFMYLTLMKTAYLFSFVVLAITNSITAQIIGKSFPDMQAETVEDKIVTLPADVNGKYTLLGLAYSKKSEDELDTWFQPVFEKFIQKNTGLFESFGYDVNVYFVPMFTGVNAAATGTAKRKAIKNVDPQVLPYILFYKGDLKPYKEALDFEKKDIPYFFVLDKDGKIVYATSGKYTLSKMNEVEEVLE